MTGGVLCERTVEDVMPALVTNKEQVRIVLLLFIVNSNNLHV